MKAREGMESLLEGVRVKGVLVSARELLRNEVTVSFMNIPVYVEDDAILLKLNSWGAEPASHIIRRRVPGTQIADGTRHLRVVFGGMSLTPVFDKVCSCGGGEEYFNVSMRAEPVCRTASSLGTFLENARMSGATGAAFSQKL
ncbi:hypothetical protein OYC64_018599 [Pagothenia borchgrevinki]|uniref:Uncharacterized protein n=1 Tax=Pagothenia borchgrevinki TaxID=8213 RepID=A0ABD2GQH3_PAGBO